MKYILKEYKQRCKEEFSIYGFKTYKSNHYRVVGDIFQSFNLHQSVSGTDCTVEFGIIPLSVEYDIDKLSCNPCHLKTFENSYEWFNYDKNSKLSMELCVNDMIVYMKKYLIPIFEKAVNSESAYLTIMEYDNVFKGNSYERFCMCLNFGDYENAKKHLQEVIEQSTNAFIRNKEVFGNNITQEYVQKMENKILHEKMLLQMIQNKDYEVIHNLFSANEKKNKLNLGIKD